MHEGLTGYINKSDNSYEAAQNAYERNCYDSSVSRYYYSAFQMMNYIVRKANPDFRVPRGLNSHNFTSQALGKIIHELDGAKFTKMDKDTAKNNLKKFGALKSLRHKADYKTEIIEKLKFDNEFKVEFDYFYDMLLAIKDI